MRNILSAPRIDEAVSLLRQCRAAEDARERQTLRDDLDQLLAIMTGDEIASAQARAFGLAEVSLARQLCS